MFCLQITAGETEKCIHARAADDTPLRVLIDHRE